jgi:hypothetical protein
MERLTPYTPGSKPLGGLFGAVDRGPERSMATAHMLAVMIDHIAEDA